MILQELRDLQAKLVDSAAGQGAIRREAIWQATEELILMVKRHVEGPGHSEWVAPTKVEAAPRPDGAEDGNAWLLRAFREELERVAQALGMPGSPDLTRDVAPRAKALAEEHAAAYAKAAHLSGENVELRLALSTSTAQVDFQAPEARRALIQWVVDWLLSRNSSQLLDALTSRQFRVLMAELDEILKHGGKPPHWSEKG